MAANPETHRSPPPVCRLQPFHAGYAGLVLSWVRDEREAFWLAPRSRPPLIASDVLQWQQPGHQPFILVEAGRAEPIGYGELNLLNASTRRYWLGHLVIDPGQRGRGCGVQLTRLLLAEAFARHGAREVSLVVFPENRRAIVCYERAGLSAEGYEWHDFPAYGRRVRLLRMAARGLPADLKPGVSLVVRPAVRTAGQDGAGAPDHR